MVLEADITGATEAYRTPNLGEFPDEFHAVFKKEWDLKYGENPSQAAAVYDLASIGSRDDNYKTTPIMWRNTKIMADLTDVKSVRTDSKGKGGLSLTNTMDICRAMDVVKFFRDEEVSAIMKHNIVAGFARTDPAHPNNQTCLFRLSRDSDLLSNFGGTAVFTRALTLETATAMYELKGQSPFFVDVVAAPEFEEGVVGYLERQSKNLRIGRFSHLEALPRFKGDETYGLFSLKEMPSGRFGVQDLYLTSVRTAEDLVLCPYMIDKQGQKHAVQKKPSESELRDLMTAWHLVIAGGRSNKVVFVKNGVSIAMGSGKVARVKAVIDAINFGMQNAMDIRKIEYDKLRGTNGYELDPNQPFNGSKMASDAFFPFPDSIEICARVGVSGIVQPYGSERDYLAIDAANKYRIAMPYSGQRCFAHF